MTGVRRHPRLRRDASVALLVLGVLAISVPPPAGGQTIVLQNDSVVDFGQVAVLPGFAADERAAKRASLPPLHGLPIAFKDLHPAAGLSFTRGSLLYKDCVADVDSIAVERLKAAGAIPIGRTNVPEFGMGSHTYNKVYGTTVNPYNLTKSAGGSSG